MNYKQTPITGDSWVRAVRVVAENPLNSAAAITFIEERVINLPDGVITQSAGNVSEPFTAANAGEVFPLLHPETGDVIGQATYQEMYVLLHSLYYHVAAKRDAGPVELPL